MYRIPKKTEQKTYHQTVEDFTNDKERRSPNSIQNKIVFYFWQPDDAKTTSKKEIKQILKQYTELCQFHYPKMRIESNLQELKIVKKDSIERIFKSYAYQADKLLDQFTTQINCGSNDVWANILITNVLMVHRPGITTTGLARRTTGHAVISTLGSVPITLVHEIGHLFGLSHCQEDLTCIMRAGSDLGMATPGKASKDEIKAEKVAKWCDTCTLKLQVSFQKIC